jgi:membrane protein
VQTRALSLTLYLVSLVVGIIVIPLVVIGPTWLGALLPEELDFLFWLYWPVVTFMAVASLTTLYHISTPRRTPWLRDLPGAVLTLVIWALASFVLRGTIAASLDSTSIYGPLSTPIVLLIWLYFLAIAVLIGAALNAAMRILWPVEERPSARARAVGWVKREVRRRRAVGGGAAAGGAAAGQAGQPAGAPAGAVATPGAGVGAPGAAVAAGAGADADMVGAGAKGSEPGGDEPEPSEGRPKRSHPLTPLPEDPQRQTRKGARKAARKEARSPS